MKRSRGKNGFTYIELLVVLGIIAIVAAFVTPNMAPFLNGIRLRNAANSIKQKLVLSKTRALGDSRIQCGVFFDTSSSPHSVFSFLDDPDSGTRGYYDPGIDTRYMGTYTLPPTISLKLEGAGINRSIVFRGDGSTWVHGIQLVVQIDENRKKLISVLPSTGRIKITTP